MIDIKDISKSFGGIMALHNVSFSVEGQTIHGIIGPNGSGKTTLLNIISGLDVPNSGQVIFNKRSITGLPSYKIALQGIARTYQNIRLFQNLTVEENLVLGRYKHFQGFLASLVRSYRMGTYISQKDQKVFDDLLHWVGIYHLKDRLASKASLAERRKIEIVRALCLDPKILLLDEPVAGMHTVEKIEMSGIIKKIKELGVTILLVDHDISTIMSICDKITVLNFGEKIATGPPQTIREDPLVIKAYLGAEDA